MKHRIPCTSAYPRATTSPCDSGHRRTYEYRHHNLYGSVQGGSGPREREMRIRWPGAGCAALDGLRVDARNHYLFWAMSFFQGAVKGFDILPASFFRSCALDAAEVVRGLCTSDRWRVEQETHSL